MTRTRLPGIVTIFTLLLHAALFAQSDIPYGNNKAAGKYIDLNGVHHYYETYGKGSPLLLIHGNTTGIKGWGPQIAYFSKTHTVYAIDCRGRGKSELGNDSLTYRGMADDMAAFIAQLHLDSVVIIGKSDGGIVGIMMGMYHPQHLSRIVAFGANMWPDSTALYTSAVNDIAHESHKADQMIAAKDTTDNWKLVRLRNRMMQFQPHITAEDLHTISVPVLVLSCDRDLIREEHTLFIYRNIPKANLCILPAETHFVPRQHPDVFNETIARYLAAPYAGEEQRYKH